MGVTVVLILYANLLNCGFAEVQNYGLIEEDFNPLLILAHPIFIRLWDFGTSRVETSRLRDIETKGHRESRHRD